MMNELADRLEAWKRDIDHWRSQDMCGIRPRRKERLLTLECSCNPVVEPNFEAIIKALRFAADMEKLATCCENIRLHKNGGAWYLDADRSDGPNIHSVENNQSILDAVSEAARKAVDALEKGEGDG